ncbi:MAG: Plug domain-containing protein [Terrimonas sp.]|nr:Plug domain-containing protein [Terrimonas sp.]OJY92987.1 MAG: hypothetical protein BGP13_21650 [Sphingobacteriales bacterium 40-81]
MKRIAFFLSLVTLVHFADAQDKVQEALQTLSEKYPQEKIYILYSKDKYVAGDNIWFKTFVFDGYNHSSISTSMYVELYNNKKALISRKLVPLFGGEGQSSFSLADSLPEGSYYVRAYTNWMLNFSEDFYYKHTLQVYNPASPQKLVADSTAEWTAAAFPEGGNFIAGAATRVAVRMQSPGVMPDAWSGYLTEASKPAEKLVSFKAIDKNVGVFNIIPEPGKKYQVTVEDKKGKKQTIALPQVAESGINLQVNSTPDAIFYSLQFKNLTFHPKGYKIIGTMNNAFVYKATIVKNVPEISSSIPTDKLINGVLHLSVFDGDDKLLAERLCFVLPQQLTVGRPAFPKLYLNKQPRGANSIDIIPDTNYTHYAVLIADGSVKDVLSEENILSTMWLTGDFTTAIDAPAQYLGVDANVAGLDALLISEKWKRFNWDDLLAGKFPEIKYLPEPYISYKGTVYGNGGIIANQSVNLIFYFKDSTNQFTQATTDSKGVFELKNMIYEEPVKVYYQVNGKSAFRDVSITFEPLFRSIDFKGSLPVSGFKLVKRPAKDPVPDDIARAMATRANQKSADEQFKTLQEVKIVAQKKSKSQELNDKLSSGMFKSMNENVFDLVNENQDAQSAQNILQWLQGRVAGLQIQMQNGNYVPIIRGSQVGLYLDEMQVDASAINSLPVSNIAMVKVIKGAFLGGIGGGGGGAVAIYTRRGDTQPANAQKAPSLSNSTLLGFDKSAPFTSPDYKDNSIKIADKDKRDVLYWNPFLEVERGKPVTIRFFNNDDAKNLRVVIVGFTKDDDIPLFYDDKFGLQ